MDNLIDIKEGYILTDKNHKSIFNMINLLTLPSYIIPIVTVDKG